MRLAPFSIFALAALAACRGPELPSAGPDTKTDRIEIVRHQGWLTAYDGDAELFTYFHIALGDGIEGDYIVKRSVSDTRRPCSLHIVPSRQARSAGEGIEIRASVPLPLRADDGSEYDGSIRLSFDQMQQLCDILPNGTPVAIRA